MALACSLWTLSQQTCGRRSCGTIACLCARLFAHAPCGVSCILPALQLHERVLVACSWIKFHRLPGPCWQLVRSLSECNVDEAASVSCQAADRTSSCCVHSKMLSASARKMSPRVARGAGLGVSVGYPVPVHATHITVTTVSTPAERMRKLHHIASRACHD